MPVEPLGKMPTATVTRQKVELTPELIQAQKKALEQQGIPPKIYKFSFDGDTFVFRPLYRSDWNRIQAFIRDNQNTISQDAIDQKICEYGIVFPDIVGNPVLWEVQRAGFQSNLAKQILGKSGFFDPDLDQSDLLKVEPLGTSERGPKPAEEVVTELKTKYNWNLRLVLVGDEYYVIRPLSRGEWKKIQQEDEADLDLLSAERATVWSKDYPQKPSFEDKLAGTVRSVAEVIMQASGFTGQAPQVEEL